MQELFNKIGEAIHGAEWKTPLAADLDLCRKSVQRYSNGEQSIPRHILKKLQAELADKMSNLKTLQAELNTSLKTLVIPRKMSGTGSIHDIASEHYDVEVTFTDNSQYVFVYADYYNAGQEFFDNIADFAKKYDELKGYSGVLFDRDFNEIIPMEYTPFLEALGEVQEEAEG